MIFHTLGEYEEGRKVIMLLHGEFMPWQLWEDIAIHFADKYFVVVPELDGHTQHKESTFESVEDEALKIKEYAAEKLNGKIDILCGMAMGGRISATLAGMPKMSVDYLILDSVHLQKIPALLLGVMRMNYRNLVKGSKNRDGKVLASCAKDFLPDRYLGEYLQMMDLIKENSVNNISDSVFSDFYYQAYSQKLNILFMHGTKGNESISKKCAQKMKEINPQTEVRCFDGYGQSQMLIFESAKWIQEVESFIEGHTSS